MCVFVGAGCASGTGDLWERWRKETMMRQGIARAGGGVPAYRIADGHLLRGRGVSFFLSL